MKKVVFVMVLVVAVLALADNTIILSSLSSLYYTRNPIDNLFKTSWIELEAFYRPLEESQSYQNVSLTFRLPFNYFSAAVTASYGGENLLDKVQSSDIVWDNEIKNVEFSANVAVQLSALIAAVTVPRFNVNFEEKEVRLSDNNVKVAIGLGNVKLDVDRRSYMPKLVKKGGAALYYINEDLLYVNSDGINPNTNPDWMNAKAGLLADAVGYNGRVVLDISFDLRGVDALKNAPDEEQGNVLLKYLCATLEIEGEPLIIGATYNQSGFLFSGGLNLFRMLKGWAEVVFDDQFNMQGIGGFVQLYF